MPQHASFLQRRSVPFFVLFVLLAMTVHLVAFERGRDQAALDFAVTVAGIVYLGWLGSYLLDLRQLPQGWVVVDDRPAHRLGGDTGAYSIGAVYGKHKMTPRLSPKKSWEGYFAGVFTSVHRWSFFCLCLFIAGTAAAGWLDHSAQGSVAGFGDRRACAAG